MNNENKRIKCIQEEKSPEPEIQCGDFIVTHEKYSWQDEIEQRVYMLVAVPSSGQHRHFILSSVYDGSYIDLWYHGPQEGRIRDQIQNLLEKFDWIRAWYVATNVNVRVYYQ